MNNTISEKTEIYKKIPCESWSFYLGFHHQFSVDKFEYDSERNKHAIHYFSFYVRNRLTVLIILSTSDVPGYRHLKRTYEKGE